MNSKMGKQTGPTSRPGRSAPIGAVRPSPSAAQIEALVLGLGSTPEPTPSAKLSTRHLEVHLVLQSRRLGERKRCRAETAPAPVDVPATGGARAGPLRHPDKA